MKPLSRTAGPRLLSYAAALWLLLVFLALPPHVSAGTSAPGAGAVAAGTGFLAQTDPEKSWEFERFDVDIEVNEDRSLSVRETQVVNFTGSFTYLYRDLSDGRADFDEGRTYGRVRFKDIEVFDLDGNPYDGDRWKTERYEAGGTSVRIEFNATDEQMGWIIAYRMTNVVIFEEDQDRLYYNAVSIDRDVRINSSRITVLLPEEVDMGRVESTEYPDEVFPPSSLTSSRDGRTLWWEAEDILPRTTVTVDVAFPKGFARVPFQFTPLFGTAMIAAAAVLFAATLVFMLLHWWRRGRDTGRPSLDVVRYEPPENLRPAVAGMLVEESPSTSHVSATIVDLAVRGKLTITEEEKKGVLRKRREFGFIDNESPEKDLNRYEDSVMAGLFASGGRVTEKDLEDKFYAHLKVINREIREDAMKRGLFMAEPSHVKALYALRSILFLVPAALIALSTRWFDIGHTLYLAPGFALAALSVFAVGRFMSARTEKGSEALSYVKGYKEYMATAEADEIKYMTPERFQENLPYAMVLGVADRWAKKFEGIFTEPPDWYRGGPAGAFSAVYLAGSLNSMQGSLNSTLTSSPSSSGGGGGGFGGGSSGGGFGGGGSRAG